MKYGIELLCESPERADAWGRCALLSNYASVNSDLVPSWKLVQNLLGSRLKQLFSPQHGFNATVQDNMIETGHSLHQESGLPIYSLYSETREPTSAMLEGIDTIIIDLQLVGCRVYTFKYTMAACLRAAAKLSKRIVVLDRPNPLGGHLVEGRVLDPDSTSFVGEFPIPMRHGLTSGEICLFFNEEIRAELEVIPLEGWDPEKNFFQTNRPWIPTSPNLPTLESAIIYPGTVIFEGTNISEGRGTALPFQNIGAPFISSSAELVDRVSSLLQGTFGKSAFLASSFQPTSQKWHGKECKGCQLIINRELDYPSFDIGIALLRSVIEMSGSSFEWKTPPYEYDFETLPIKLIMGSQKAADMFAKDHFSLTDMFWHEGIGKYLEKVKPFLLYPREMRLP